MRSPDIYEECLEFGKARLAAKPDWVERRATELYRLLRKAARDGSTEPWQLRRGGLIVANALRAILRLDLALIVARWAMSIDPDSGVDEGYYHFLVGSCYMRIGAKAKEAVLELSRALELVEDDSELLADVHEELARALQQARDYERAVEHYEKVIELLPEPCSDEERGRKEWADIRIVECQWDMRQHDRAMEAIERILGREHLHPCNRPLAYSVRAALHVDRRDFEAAAADYRSAIRIADEDIERRRRAPYPEEGREMDIWSIRNLKARVIPYLRRCEQEIERQRQQSQPSEPS